MKKDLREKRDISIQVRINEEEKQIIEELRKLDKDFNVSQLFRESLHRYYIETVQGVGNFYVS